MPEALRLVLALHCHQPIGNFGWVIEQATAGAYRPTLEALARHPSIPCVLHLSGPLLEWWERHAPDVVAAVAQGVARGQFELMASGLYEPVLPAIPRRDRIDQVRLHRALLRERFGADAESLWLTERVWEPTLPSDLAAAGIGAVLVDDTQFEGAGLALDELDGGYATEDEGRTVQLFPISKELRYRVPFHPVEQVVAWLRARHEAGQRLLVYGDDGEKFGLWPGTRQWVWEGGWLERFLSALEEQRGWLQPATLAQARRDLRSAGRVYLPASSYFEMGHWSLPPRRQLELDALLADLSAHGLREKAAPFLRGAVWRNFLARYPEANRLQQRMVRLSERTRAMGLRPAGGLQSPAQLHPAVRHLFRGQCNCAYWHGVFGGLYLPFLRDALVEELLECRARLEELRGDQAGLPSCEVADVDCDGEQEVVLDGRGFTVWIAPARGGLVELLDHWPSRRNLLNVLGRRREAYHDELLRAHGADGAAAAAPTSIHDQQLALAGAAQLLRYDERPRGAFALELASAGADLDLLAETRGEDLLRVAGARMRLARAPSPSGARVELAATLPAGRGARLDVARRYELLEDGSLRHEVELVATGRELEPCLATLRFDLSVPGGGDEPARRFELEDGRTPRTGEEAAFEGCVVRFGDERGRFELACDRRFVARLRPIRTVSRSEGGVDTVLQGSALLLAFEAAPAPGRPWQLSATLRPLARQGR